MLWQRSGSEIALCSAFLYPSSFGPTEFCATNRNNPDSGGVSPPPATAKTILTVGIQFLTVYRISLRRITMDARKKALHRSKAFQGVWPTAGLGLESLLIQPIQRIPRYVPPWVDRRFGGPDMAMCGPSLPHCSAGGRSCIYSHALGKIAIWGPKNGNLII